MKTKICKKDNISHIQGYNNEKVELSQIDNVMFINNDFKCYFSYTLLYIKIVDTLKVDFL